MDKLNANRVALSLAVTAAIIHTLAVLGRVLFFPGNELMAQMFELMHPFATWLTLGGFIISSVEAIIAGLFVGYVYAAIYNTLGKK